MERQGNNLIMNRGDTEPITISAKNEDGTKHLLEKGDIVYFTVKESVSDDKTKFVFQKKITNFIDGDAVDEIKAEDTRDLECKKYVYDVRMKKANGRVSTIIKTSNFTLLKEVTYIE